MPLPFNKTLDLKLLALVKENPIIYNSKDPKYLDFDTREVVWQKIGDTLNRPGMFIFFCVYCRCYIPSHPKLALLYSINSS